MEIRRCGSVGKVRNINHHGSPSPSFKALKDLRESIDGTALPAVNSCDMQARLLVVDRKLREIETENDESDPHSDGLDIDLDDATTLTQLKDRFLEKKRKLSHGDENPVEYKTRLDPLREIKSEKEECVPSSDNSLDNDSEDGITLTQLRVRRFHEKKRRLGGSEDRSILYEPVISLKSKNSKISSSSTTLFNNIKCEPNPVFQRSQQVGCGLAPLIRVKFEDSESPRKTSIGNEASCPADEVSSGIEFKKPLFSPEECRICVTNMISYEHLDDFESAPEIFPSEKMNGNSETLDELCCDEVLEEISEQSSSSGVQHQYMATDGTIRCIGEFVDNYKLGLSHGQDNSLSTPNLNCESSQDSVTSLKVDDGSLVPIIITNKEHPVTHVSLNDIAENGLNSRTNINDELVRTTAENRPSPEKQSFGCAGIISTTESCQPPERLLSTRKVISPSSQEQLCSAMNSVDTFDDVNQYVGSERKGKLCERETWRKAPSARSDIQHAKIDANHGKHDGQVSQRKVNLISSRHIYKKYQDSKVNREGPRFSRILPNLSTECTSIQSCSERAIAFSQRQMQDTESLAFKLMEELESMKSIVEQKLVFEVYRNVPLKSDADEVKSAIKSATKVEERARKWLSTMSRDCKRFCKIMNLTPNASPASNDVVPRENRKIVFADEAGGKLCHVKYFEAGVTPPASDCVKQ